MWNLNGDDIKNAKEQLETRRVKLKTDYEEELKRIDAELADIETVERVAVNFVSTRKGEKSPDPAAVPPEKGADKEPSAAEEMTEMKVAEKPGEHSSDKEDKPEIAPTEQKGSRWRMRLGTVSETEAAD